MAPFSFSPRPKTESECILNIGAILPRSYALALCLFVVGALSLGCDDPPNGDGQTSIDRRLSTEDDVLVFLQPLGHGSDLLGDLDDSLTSFLRVELCTPLADGSCTAVASLDATSGGDERLRLAGSAYMATYDVNPDNTDSLRIGVSVAGLDLGYVDTELRGAVVIRFVVRNDSAVRARVLAEQGLSSTEIASVLFGEFDLSAADTAGHLQREGFSAVGIAVALRDVYGQTAEQTATIQRDLGFSCVDIGGTLAQVYGSDAPEATSLLAMLGFSAAEIGAALRAVYALNDADTASALKLAGFGADAIYDVLKSLYDVDFDEGGALLHAAGFTGREALRATFDDMSAFYSEIADTIGPIVRVHPDELYEPASVDWFLARAKVEDTNCDACSADRESLIELSENFVERNDLRVACEDTGLVASVADVCTDEPSAELGPPTLTLRSNEEKLSGDPATALHYVHILRQEGFTDLQFWLFYPFNGAGATRLTVDSLLFNYTPPKGGTRTPPLGEHQSDWEVVILRLDDNDALESVFMSAHGKYHRYGPDEIEFSDGHVVAYSSLNGHANYPVVGDNGHDEVSEGLVVPSIDFSLGCLPQACVNECACPLPEIPGSWVCPVNEICVPVCELFKGCKNRCACPLPQIPGSWFCPVNEVCVDVCVPETPQCANFATPEVYIGEFKIQTLNITATGGAEVSDYEIVGAYDASLGADVLVPTHADSEMHWIEFPGYWSPQKTLHLPAETVGDIVYEQGEPIVKAVCRLSNLDSFGVTPSCSPFDWIPGVDACGITHRAFLDRCRQNIQRAVGLVPQEWLDERAPGGVLEASRLPSPGSRHCNPQAITMTDSEKPEWIYAATPKDIDCCGNGICEAREKRDGKITCVEDCWLPD